MFEALTADENQTLWLKLFSAAKRHGAVANANIGTDDKELWRRNMDAWHDIQGIQDDVTAAYRPDPALRPTGTGWPVKA